MATKKEKRISFLRTQIAQQEDWIKQCGGSLYGYVQHYGSAGDPKHYGDGGEAIYAADYGALTRMQDELRTLTA